MSTPHPTSQPVWVQPAAPRTNGLAIASLVLGICGFALIPVIFGHVALKQIRSRGEGGTGLAVAGLILGYLALIGWIAAVIAIGVGITAGVIHGAR